MKETLAVALILVFFMFTFYPSYSALSVGVSPSFLDIGEIEPGTSKIARFYVITPSEDVTLVQLKSYTGNFDAFKRNGYENFIHNYSEERIDSWVEFIGNPLELKKNKEQKTKGIIRAANEVIFVVKVPKDAEPGYHAGLISIDPIARDQPGMITIKSLVPFVFVFKVPGRSVREGRILEISTGAYYDDRLSLEVFFQNTGSVTIKPKSSVVQLFYDEKSQEVLYASVDYVKPGETKKFTAIMPAKNVKEGKYNVTAEVDYVTGKAFKASMVELYKPLVPIVKVVEKEFVFPWWVIVVLLIFIIAYFYYKR